MKIVFSLLAMTVAFFAIDIAWIALFVSAAYEEAFGPMLKETPSAAAAGLFYAGYLGGIYYLAVRPALSSRRISTAIVAGAVLGALSYGTYALTNYALFEGWIVSIVVADILWGAFLTAATAGIGYLTARGRKDSATG
jgi:uncharacterized membrane protein